MSYQLLAHKYRPQTFADLTGQEATALALAGALKQGREPTGVMLAGIRGVGKTTIARLYAKALNCSARNGADPCNRCPSCQAITAGRHEDVVEIDGASHNGVEEIRALRESTHYVAQRGGFKVYIIDEVHMLSVSAFNALLKTLEEPPPRVIFIFATTELRKVPATVVGRCQTFHLGKISLDAIAGRLAAILQREEVPFEEEALTTIARQGQGSLRDAITFLDQVLALGDGQGVTRKALEELLPHCQTEHYLELLDALVAQDAERCLGAIERFDRLGVDFILAWEELARLVRAAIIARELGAEALAARATGLAAADTEKLATIAGQAAPLTLNNLFRSLMATRRELDGSSLDRFCCENMCFEWACDPGWAHALADYLDRGEAQAGERPSQPARTAPMAPPSAAPVPAPPTLAPPAADPWAALVERVKAKHPIQGRKLEELELQSFSPQAIAVTITASALSARDFLGAGQPAKWEALLQAQGYSGRFQVSESGASQKGKGTLLTAKEAAQNEQMRQAAEHPVTQAWAQQFGTHVAETNLVGPSKS